LMAFVHSDLVFATGSCTRDKKVVSVFVFVRRFSGGYGVEDTRIQNTNDAVPARRNSGATSAALSRHASRAVHKLAILINSRAVSLYCDVVLPHPKQKPCDELHIVRKFSIYSGRCLTCYVLVNAVFLCSASDVSAFCG
jgi:hypothetical protein